MKALKKFGQEAMGLLIIISAVWFAYDFFRFLKYLVS